MEWIVLEETDSTNRVAVELARQGAPEGTAVLALRQTAGRGRRGRSFFSPEGGVYLSVILRPRLRPEDLCLITPMAADAVCRAVEDCCGKSLSIKWVNDLLLEGRKICGILCEGADGAVAAGVGVNYAAPEGGFPPELEGIAGALYPHGGGPVSREELARAMAERLLEGCRRLERGEDVLEGYRRRSILPGKRIRVHPLAGPAFDARALEIDRRGRLVVQAGDGGLLALDSGEVSVRLEAEP